MVAMLSFITHVQLWQSSTLFFQCFILHRYQITKLAFAKLQSFKLNHLCYSCGFRFSLSQFIYWNGISNHICANTINKQCRVSIERHCNERWICVDFRIWLTYWESFELSIFSFIIQCDYRLYSVLHRIWNNVKYVANCVKGNVCHTKDKMKSIHGNIPILSVYTTSDVKTY